MPFKCNCCGVCCKMLNTAYPGVEELVSDDGHTCKYLVDNKCSIYAHRPDFCNTEIMFEKIYSRIMSREEYDAMNEESCKILFKDFSQN